MHWRSKLIHSDSKIPQGFRSLAMPTYRGSTIVFDSQETVREGWRQENGYTYGLYGTPTALELGARIAEMEGARFTFLTPSGQAAIALIYFTFCDAGSHVLLPDNAYGSNKELTEGVLGRYGVEVERYDPMIGAGIAELIRPETSLIWCESPGSVTMEVQDVPAIVAAAHARGVVVALDNTYAAGVMFDAFAFGVDVSMQALTKYIGGHSDLLLGSVSVRSEAEYLRVGKTHRHLGLNVSPDDCSLALRGMQTLGVRLEALERSTFEIAAWMAARPEVAHVLHPALDSCVGHEFWKRDFTGSSSLFSVVFVADVSREQAARFVNALTLFKIGWSWGGVTSVVMGYPELGRMFPRFTGQIVRFGIGLEEISDLIGDLGVGFEALKQGVTGMKGITAG